MRQDNPTGNEDGDMTVSPHRQSQRQSVQLTCTNVPLLLLNSRSSFVTSSFFLLRFPAGLR